MRADHRIALALFGTILVYMAAHPVVGEGLQAMVWTTLLSHAAGFDPAPSRAVSSVAAICAVLLLFFVVPFLSAPVLTSATAAAAALAR